VIGTQENPPSNITKLQNIQRGRTNVGISSNKIFTITCAKYSNIEILHRKHNACTMGTPENPKTRRIYIGISANINSQPAQIYERKSGSEGHSLGGHYELAPLGPINLDHYLANQYNGNRNPTNTGALVHHYIIIETCQNESSIPHRHVVLPASLCPFAGPAQRQHCDCGSGSLAVAVADWQQRGWQRGGSAAAVAAFLQLGSGGGSAAVAAAVVAVRWRW
jgi:hypothetical protein